MAVCSPIEAYSWKLICIYWERTRKTRTSFKQHSWIRSIMSIDVCNSASMCLQNTDPNIMSKSVAFSVFKFQFCTPWIIQRPRAHRCSSSQLINKEVWSHSQLVDVTLALWGMQLVNEAGDWSILDLLTECCSASAQITDASRGWLIGGWGRRTTLVEESAEAQLAARTEYTEASTLCTILATKRNFNHPNRRCMLVHAESIVLQLWACRGPRGETCVWLQCSPGSLFPAYSKLSLQQSDQITLSLQSLSISCAAGTINTSQQLLGCLNFPGGQILHMLIWGMRGSQKLLLVRLKEMSDESRFFLCLMRECGMLLLQTENRFWQMHLKDR